MNKLSLCPIGVPLLTITNTRPEFAWLVNYVETLMSCMLWQPITSATIAYEYKKLLNKYALETTGSTEGVQWQGHDFSMRGMSSPESAILSGMGHLLSFTGTDTIPAIYTLETSYRGEGLIGASVPATEHSVMCMGTKESEIETFRRLLNLYPTGILSVVSDTWDLWKVCTEYLPQLKEEILARGNPKYTNAYIDGEHEDWFAIALGENNHEDIVKVGDQFFQLHKGPDWDSYTEVIPNGKLVIRPDSGDPVDIICGTQNGYGYNESGFNSYEVMESEHKRLYKSCKHSKNEYKGVIELLWDIFGGTVNKQGFKVLDPHIGAIYGDSITIQRATEICERLKAKGFASTNIVFGIGLT